MSDALVITVSAVCFERSDGAVLTVRKRGTRGWMLPGGKPETGESAIHCAIREIDEELDIQLTPQDLELLGRFETQAVNEAGMALIATVFHTPRDVDPTPRAEIGAYRWAQPQMAITDPTEAPLNREHIYPLLADRRSRCQASAG